MNWQLFDAFGIFLGFAANLIVSQTGDNRWRYEVASVVIPTVVLLSLVWTIPESPRWLLKKGRYQDAFASFCALRETPLQAAAELFYANAQIQAEIKLLGRKARRRDPEAPSQNTSPAISDTLRRREMAYIGHNANNRNSVIEPTARLDREAETQRTAVEACLPLPQRLKRAWDTITNQKDDYDLEEYQRCAKTSFYVTRVWQLFSMPRIRRATTAALVMMITQQMCGIVSSSDSRPTEHKLIISLSSRTSFNSTAQHSSTTQSSHPSLYSVRDSAWGSDSPTSFLHFQYIASLTDEGGGFCFCRRTRV